MREGKYRIYSQQIVELLSFIKCAQQLGFKLKEMQAIFQDYRGEEIPWDLAQQAIADKKHELRAQIDTLQSLHDGLVEFEASVQDARAQCSFELSRLEQARPAMS